MIFEMAIRPGRRNFFNLFGGLLSIVMHKTLYFGMSHYLSDFASPKKMVKIRGRLHVERQSTAHFIPK